MSPLYKLGLINEVNMFILAFLACGTTITYNDDKMLNLIQLEGLLLKVLSKVVCYFKVGEKLTKNDCSNRKTHLLI